MPGTGDKRPVLFVPIVPVIGTHSGRSMRAVSPVARK
jgi:hypothetical protein